MSYLKPKIVLIYNRSTGCFNDKFDTIESLQREGAWVFVKYRGSGKEYKYGSQNIFIQTLKEQPNLTLNDIIIDGERRSDIAAIGNYGTHYGVIYKKSRTPEYITASRVVVKYSIGKAFLEYIKGIAVQIKDEEPDSDEVPDKLPFLYRQVYSNIQRNEIGIITPYRPQADLLKKTGIESDTVHKFQGREKKRIIFSTVSDKIFQFMDQAELINVAVSRAVDQFVMVMPQSYELTHGSNICDLIRYIEHLNPSGVVDSGIVSCFDLLQPVNAARLYEFKKKVKGASRFESENIVEEVISKILNETPAYSGFYIQRSYPLYLLTPNKAGLTEREIAYSNNRLSHVDFLIINRCDNSFVLAIEVDGYTYHSQVQQQERDAIKNKVLALNGIELLRLSTRGYQEEGRIQEKIKSITGSDV